MLQCTVQSNTLFPVRYCSAFSSDNVPLTLSVTAFAGLMSGHASSPPRKAPAARSYRWKPTTTPSGAASRAAPPRPSSSNCRSSSTAPMPRTASRRDRARPALRKPGDDALGPAIQLGWHTLWKPRTERLPRSSAPHLGLLRGAEVTHVPGNWGEQSASLARANRARPERL